MAIPSGTSTVIVPEPFASRLRALVASGEFPTFEAAALAMIQLGLLQHDQRTLPPAAGPAPPDFDRGLPGPGGGGPGAPPVPPGASADDG